MKKLSFILLAGALVLALCIAPVATVSAGANNRPGNADGFMTGGGKVVDEEGNFWTFGGNVGVKDGSAVGQFEITDHTAQVTWHCHGDISALSLLSPAIEGPRGPSAGFSIVEFTGNFTGNNGETATLTIVLTDNDEPGIGNDTIEVTGDFSFGGTLYGGNFQAHKGSYSGPPS
jgi:hypothetical protein